MPGEFIGSSVYKNCPRLTAQLSYLFTSSCKNGPRNGKKPETYLRGGALNRDFDDDQPHPAPEIPSTAIPTSYEDFVTTTVGRMTRTSGTIDQRVLRQCLGLASSYLVTDSTMSPATGLTSWNNGFNRLIDLLVVLHARDELELDTVSAASKACSECWTATENWSEVEDSKDNVRAIAVRLKGVLDENGRTYRGERVYVP